MPDDFGIDKKTLAYVLILVLTGNASVVFLNKASPEMRADAFTATDGKALQSQIRQIYAIQQTMLHRMSTREEEDSELKKLIESHLRRHP